MHMKRIIERILSYFFPYEEEIYYYETEDKNENMLDSTILSLTLRRIRRDETFYVKEKK